VTPRVDEPEPLEAVIGAVSETTGIPSSTTAVTSGCVSCRCATRSGCRLRRGSSPDSTRAGEGTRTRARGASAGALTKYFGKRTSGEYKFRGIELRQRSTPAFVADGQRAFVEALDRERDPEAVCDVLGRRLNELLRGMRSGGGARDHEPRLEVPRRLRPADPHRGRARAVRPPRNRSPPRPVGRVRRRGRRFARPPSASDSHSRSPRNTTPTTTRRCSCGPARASSRRWVGTAPGSGGRCATAGRSGCRRSSTDRGTGECRLRRPTATNHPY